MGPVRIVHLNCAPELHNFANREGGTAKTRRTDRVQRYVPHMNVHATGSLDDIAELVNRERRFYLRPVDESAKQAAIDDILEDTSEDNGIDFHIFDMHKGEKDASVLDLGTVALQRIVTQMKGLRYDVQESVYIKDSAKLSGLKRYGDYILGKPRVERDDDIFVRM